MSKARSRKTPEVVPPAPSDGDFCVVDLSEPGPPRPPGPASLAPGNAPSCFHPGISRKQAAVARRRGKIPLTNAIEQGIAGGLMNRMTQEQIAKAMHYSPRYIGRLIRQQARSIQSRMLRAYQKKGLDLDRAAEYHLRLLEAKRLEFAKHRGQITDERPVEDNPTRLGALELFFDVIGARNQTPERGHAPPDNRMTIVNVNCPDSVFFADTKKAQPHGDATG